MVCRDSPTEPYPSPKYVSLQLPYLGYASNNIGQELSSFIRHKPVVKLKLRCLQNTRKLQGWFSVEYRQALLNRFKVVYRFASRGMFQESTALCTHERNFVIKREGDSLV